MGDEVACFVPKMNLKGISLDHFPLPVVCADDFYLSVLLLTCKAPLSVGFLQARILEWLAISSPRVSSQPRDLTNISCIFCIPGGFFTTKCHSNHYCNRVRI